MGNPCARVVYSRSRRGEVDGFPQLLLGFSHPEPLYVKRCKSLSLLTVQPVIITLSFRPLPSLTLPRNKLHFPSSPSPLPISLSLSPSVTVPTRSEKQAAEKIVIVFFWWCWDFLLFFLYFSFPYSQMSEGFELSTFHVPQQSRRDKLRETAAVAAAAAASHSGLLPLYDHPALLTSPSSILTCSTPDTAPHLVKEEGLNFMGFAAAASSSSHMFLDPCAQEDIPSPFFYPPQHAPHAHPIRDFCYPGPAPHAALSYVPPAQGLSLSLSSSSEYPNRSTVANQPTAGIFDQKGGGGGGCGAARGFSIVGGGMSRSSVPLGPFTGYSAVLKGSRFLEPARELLEEFCDVGRGGIAVPRRAGAGAGSSAEDDREMESLSGAVLGDGAAGISEDRRRKTRLVSLLNEVCVVQQCRSLLTPWDGWAPNLA